MTRKIVRDLVAQRVLLVEDGNHGEYRPRPGEFVDVGVPFIRAADMSSGTIDFDGAGKINAIARDRIRKGIGKPGDVILSHKGTVGRVAIAPMDSPDFVCSPQTTFWRSLDPTVLDQRYLRYAMRSPSFMRQLEVLKGQTDMAPYVSLTDQRSIELELPPIVTQQVVAEVLGALDDKIAVNERLCSLADQLCAAQVQKASVMGVRRQLRDVLTLHYGKALPASERTPGDVVVYGSGGITGMHSRPLVNRPGVIVGRKGTVGAIYWASGPHFPIDTTYYVEPREVATDEILYYLLRSAPLAELNSDSAVPGLNRDEAYACQVNLPEKDSLETLSRNLRQRFSWMKLVHEEMKALAVTRDELLPLMMSGNVRVREAEKIVEGVV
ncbi:restriction endonuclease subunit S [Amycolatopsis silviterrae]|uniref:Restriction endonuclease subunit S n=1 Tax=Amycolatopsis silviterrae TaxID=1656914 RepID=A0ABW5HIQ3_9PSEU